MKPVVGSRQRLVLPAIAFLAGVACTPATGGGVASDGGLRVIGCQSKKSPPEYSYTVQNHDPRRLKELIVGPSKSGAKLKADPPEVEPTAVEGPPGWPGRVVFGPESDYFGIHWQASKPEDMIPKGKDVKGFHIVLGLLTDDRLKAIDVKTLPDFTSLSYFAVFESGGGRDGRMVAEKCP